jgi:hypothetical protein
MQSAFHGHLVSANSHYPIPYTAMYTYKRLMPQVMLHVHAKAPDAQVRFHSVELITVEGHQFCASVFKNAAHSHRLIYMIIPNSNDFEVLAMDGNKYYLYDCHFFLRYRQRLHIMHRPAAEVLKHFLEHNPLTVFARNMGKRRRISDRMFFMAAIHTGVVYGHYSTQHRVYIFDTMINYYTLGADKWKKFGKLRNVLRKLEGK